MRSRSVARDHQCLYALASEIRGDLAAVTKDRVGTLRSVGHARRVAKVNDALVGKLADHLAYDGEAADARIENADRRRIAHRRRTDAYTPALRGVATTPMFALKSQRLAAT